jgi:hypothetical protein
MGEANVHGIAGTRRRRAKWAAMACLSVAILTGAIVIQWRSSAIAQIDNVDQATSQALTSYLKQNRLPLVGAQVIKATGGQQRVVLYGFVASDEGKQDAERKVIAYLGTPVPTIDDRLVVKPELATMTAPQPQDQAEDNQPGDTQAAQGQGSAAAGGMSFEQLYQQIQQYGIKNPPGE